MKVDYKLYSIIFYSRNFLAIEINYEINNKQILAIVDLFLK